MGDKVSTEGYPRVEIVIFIGLQASGKSSFYRSRFADTHVHVSKDLLRNNRNRDRRQRQLIEAAFEQRRSVVVDNTNATAEARAPLIELGRSFHAEIIGYYFDSSVERCLERNRRREGKDRVPDVAIYVTIKKLERPSYGEGFDKLFSVRITEEGRFEIEESKRI